MVLAMLQYIKAFFQKNSLEYKLFEHPAVFTCEESKNLAKVPGTTCKNLFLKNKKGRQFYLIIIPTTKTLDLKKTKEMLEEKKLGFANEVELKEILDLTPGSVSILGLLNDKEKKVKLYIDKELWEAKEVSFHPNENTASLVVDKKTFHTITKLLKPDFQLI